MTTHSSLGPAPDPAPPTAAAQPRWSRLYALVLAELAVCVALFYLFTRYFSS